jgi:hypothetical protein
MTDLTECEGQAQPKSDAWLEFRAIQAAKKQRAASETVAVDAAVIEHQQLELSA